MIRNEQLKLLATTLNNLGLAHIGGFIAPTLSSQPAGWHQVFWVCVGIGLHRAAIAVLGRMTP